MKILNQKEVQCEGGIQSRTKKLILRSNEVIAEVVEMGIDGGDDQKETGETKR